VTMCDEMGGEGLSVVTSRKTHRLSYDYVLSVPVIAGTIRR